MPEQNAPIMVNTMEVVNEKGTCGQEEVVPELGVGGFVVVGLLVGGLGLFVGQHLLLVKSLIVIIRM